MSEAAPPAWTGEDVRERFNAIPSVLYYTRAAHSLGIWKSERLLIERLFPDRETPLVEAGCGSGRVTLALWRLGFARIVAFDFADELLDQAKSLANEKGASSLTFLCADATKVGRDAFGLGPGEYFGGALMMFNGLMQIPGRENRRAALRSLRQLCREGAPFLFTTHDRDRFREEAASWWGAEESRWASGRQDPRLSEFGDRHFEDESGEVFIHIPDRAEILSDLAETGWAHRFDAMRSEIAEETRAVTAFSDDCRFWVAERV